MEDNRSFETQEQSDSRIGTNEAARVLESATYEPEARVESVETFAEAEAIEAAFVEVVDAAGSEQSSALPIQETGPASTDDEISATPIPLPGPSSSSDEISATPIPLPGPLSANDEVSATPIPLPGDGRPQEANEGTLPEALHQDVVSGMEGRMPESELPDLREGMPGDFGDGMPGDLRDGVDGLIPGGFGFSDIPGSDRPGSYGPGSYGPGSNNPFGGHSGPGLYGPGSEGPPAGPDGPLPGGHGQSDLMGDSGGGGMFWEWNLMPGKQSQYEHGRELTGMDDANESGDLEYSEKWSDDSPVGEKDMIDPFTGRYEEEGQATGSDYDEGDKDRENFAEQQKIYEEEKAKQKEAEEKRKKNQADQDDDDDDDDKKSGSGSSASEMMPVDGVEGEGRAPISVAPTLNWGRLGGLLVFDPPEHDTSAGPSGGPGIPGASGISDFAMSPEADGGGAPRRDTPKIDPSHVTDPVPNKEVGKEAADKGG